MLLFVTCKITTCCCLNLDPYRFTYILVPQGPVAYSGLLPFAISTFFCTRISTLLCIRPQFPNLSPSNERDPATGGDITFEQVSYPFANSEQEQVATSDPPNVIVLHIHIAWRARAGLRDSSVFFQRLGGHIKHTRLVHHRHKSG